MTEKVTCRTCEQAKSEDDFYIRSDTGKRRSDCKACMGKGHVDSRLQRLYGITLEDFHRMKSEQGGVCAICQTILNGRQLHVDHCHDTGRVRGLLCDNCNKGIGLLRDDPTLIRRAADYVDDSRT